MTSDRSNRPNGGARLLAVVAAAAVLVALAAPAADARRHPRKTARLETTQTLIGMRAAAPSDPYSFEAVNAWQGKRNAIGTIFRRTNTPNDQLVAKLAEVWASGAVPMLSIDLVDSNATIASGARDEQIDATALAIKTWLSGPDGSYGTADDRRIYLRLAWEPNGNWYRWSPCHADGGTAADYRRMWVRYHKRYRRLGIDRSHLAWVFSVNQTDWKTDACTAESLYPGHKYVDWLGIDGYTWSFGQGPAEVFGPMAARLRAMAPGTPLGINEAGVHRDATIGKSAYLTAYFEWIRANDIGMAVWFNIDKEKDWSVFGGLPGDEHFTHDGQAHLAWKAYRLGVAAPNIVGSDPTNPRLLTDAQFLPR